MHNRAWYVTKPERELREHHLLIPRMYVEVHNDLHRNLEPPIKPHPGLVIGALALLETFRDDMSHIEALERVADHFDHLDGSDAIVGGRIALNLYQQLTYVEQGYVRESWNWGRGREDTLCAV